MRSAELGEAAHRLKFGLPGGNANVMRSVTLFTPAFNLLPSAMKLIAAGLLAASTTACSQSPRAFGSRDVHSFTLPAPQAAQCFARNARNHSAALAAQVTERDRQRYDVQVSVRNGTPYASVLIEPLPSGSRGVIELNVQSSRGNRELVEILVRGC